MHNVHCEPPSELCCGACTEAAHDTFPTPHADGSRCVLDHAGPPSGITTAPPGSPATPTDAIAELYRKIKPDEPRTDRIEAGTQALAAIIALTRDFHPGYIPTVLTTLTMFGLRFTPNPELPADAWRIIDLDGREMRSGRIAASPCPYCGSPQRTDIIDVTRAPGHPPEYLPGLTRCTNPQCGPALITMARPMNEDEAADFRDRWIAACRSNPHPEVLPTPTPPQPRGWLARLAAHWRRP
jgi:hypothetical protein